MKVYLMKIDTFKTKENKQFYKAFCFSAYGFTFDLFLNENEYLNFEELIDERGFVDISDDVDLRFNKKLDKLEYYLKK